MTAVVTQVLDQMVSLGECEEVYLDGEKYLAPAEPRWLPTGNGLGVYLGLAPPPSDLLVSGSPEVAPLSIVQRVRVATEEDEAVLEVAGIRKTSIAEWLSPLGYLAHVARRVRHTVRSDQFSLTRYWEILEASLVDEGLPAGSDAELRIVAGEPGGFFGSHDAVDIEGRWAQEVDYGVWCGFRRGYGDAHWHPVIVAADEGMYRLLDLHDRDEWHWALLARGFSLGPKEVVDRSSGSVGLTCPVPAQLRTAMSIVGARTGPWAWQFPPDAPDVWDLLKRAA
jgi:hypothetical protein